MRQQQVRSRGPRLFSPFCGGRLRAGDVVALCQGLRRLTANTSGRFARRRLLAGCLAISIITYTGFSVPVLGPWGSQSIPNSRPEKHCGAADGYQDSAIRTALPSLVEHKRHPRVICMVTHSNGVATGEQRARQFWCSTSGK